MKTALALCLALFGCQNAPNLELNGAADDQFTVTRIQVNADGTGTVLSTATMTRQHQLDEAIQRSNTVHNGADGVKQSALIVSDSGCAGLDMWMFDQINFQGNGLCLTGVGDAWLANFPRGTGNWAGAVRSYWSGSSPGYFYGRGTVGGTVYFSALSPLSPVPAALQADLYIHLDCNSWGYDLGTPHC